MMKILFIIIDGLGDEPIPALGNKTPLEAAEKPNLNFLAKNGIFGSVIPYARKRELPTSEDCHLALFGYEPKIYNPGRGVLETLGMEIKISPSDVCFRGNFATVSNNLTIIDRRAGRIKRTEPLIKSINGLEIQGVKFLISKGVSHRIGIIMRGKGLSPKISNSDPKLTQVRPVSVKPLEKSKEADFTAEVLNQFLEKAYQILKEHSFNRERKLPANYILVRGAGTLKKIEGFEEKYNLKAACIAAGALYKGIAKYLGMDLIKVSGANALPTTNLKNKFLAVKRVLKNANFVFCHIKAADNLAEDGNFFGKKEFIEKIDKNLKPILRLKNTLIIITGDHSTCSLQKSHCKEPIPIFIFGCGKRKFEKINQIDIMKVILKLAKKINK